ncbi:hypothetical protein GC088_12620 [Arthrobacter sp. JZ12]|nr:hypothetical protein GC088_12620 [Arthrobacter sp. JZ12]
MPAEPRRTRAAASASPDLKRRIRRLTYFGAVWALVLLIFSFLPIGSEPWVWVKVAVLAVGTVVFVTLVARFSLWQRNEYWRERGRNPQHPDRPSGA